MLHLEKRAGVLPAGSSGCPVMLEKYGNYYLVGLHFSGCEDDQDGEAEALLWKKGIEPYIQKGVQIISGIGSYLAHARLAAAPNSRDDVSKNLASRAKQEKVCLELTAKTNQLTIYLTNGEILKGLQSE